MSHDLEITADGTASFVSVREPAWHRLGIVWPDDLTVTEALLLARADYEVRTVPLFAFDDGKAVAVAGKVATVRSDPDTGRPVVLGTMTDRYRVVQNAEAFAFGDSLVDGGARPETCGVLGAGERAFMSFIVGDEIRIGGVDAHRMHLLVTTGHDGRTPVGVFATPVRAVCQNTVRMAIGSARSAWTARHTASVAGRVEEARRSLELTFAYQAGWREAAERMLDQPMSDGEFATFLDELVPVDPDAPQRTRTNAETLRAELAGLYFGAETQANIRGTRWAAYNAVAEYVDHLRPVRAGGADATDARAAGWFDGRGSHLTDRAGALLAG